MESSVLYLERKAALASIDRTIVQFEIKCGAVPALHAPIGAHSGTKPYRPPRQLACGSPQTRATGSTRAPLSIVMRSKGLVPKHRG